MATRSSRDIPKAYDPTEVERRLYDWWERSGFFMPRTGEGRPPFTIIMPPPNVTGELHIGHALTAAIEDALIRYHRMLGYAALWLPGTDHAGIATQMVVERELALEGIARQDMGRQAFERRVWEWVGKYGDIIDHQHRLLGASCDWTRKTFTLDPGPSRAVRATFKRLHDKGLIYRGERLINWDTALHTSLSDLEVEHRQVEGHLYHVRYPLEEPVGSLTHLTVATTRPETLLGDTAVAVNPDDPRYRDLPGKRVLLPLLHRPLPIIADSAVSPEFGTGVLKITPGHDHNDFEIGERHKLPIVSMMHPDGTLNAEAGPFEGLDRFEARRAIVEELHRQQLLARVDPHVHMVGHSQRSGEMVEPLISTQWFVKVGPLAQRAADAVRTGSIRIVPERLSKVYLNWMDNIRDWCISRQLWWGHRIPVWYCAACGHATVAIDDPVGCEACGSVYISQDADVLDTWFSSGLWPHSTLGWPEDTDDLRTFYPTQVMETGYDILFFWVARMIMLGIENTGQIPFDTVYLHGLVRAEDGQKISKTKGNVVDPIPLLETYGADAVRFALISGNTAGNDSRLRPERLQASRNFANKIWNAARYVLNVLESSHDLVGWSENPPRNHREDRWILSRLAEVTAEVRSLWDGLRLNEAQQVLHDFAWGELCDWYIELAKLRLRAHDPDPHRVLSYALERLLRLLHPFMPFLTEELWQRLTERLPTHRSLPQSIMLAPYPEDSDEDRDHASMEEMALVMRAIRAVRNVRTELRVPADRRLAVSVQGEGDALRLVEAERPAIEALARASVGTAAGEETHTPAGVVHQVVGPVTLLIHLAETVDLATERSRLQADLDHQRGRAEGLQARLADAGFSEKAPPEVRTRAAAQLREAEERILQLQQLLQGIRA